MVAVIGASLLGLVLGSFAGAQVWRLRARELATGEGLTTQESRQLRQLKPLLKHTFTTDRSICLHCRHALAWFDLIPLLSWLSTLGKCRYCRTPIGTMEPLIELSTSAYIMLSYLVLFAGQPLTMLLLVRALLWISAGVCIAILFWYDLRWSMLPLAITMLLIAIALLYAGTIVATSQDIAAASWSLLGSLMILSGLYFALYTISHGSWVGGGDYKLGAGLALLLGDWRLALAALFIANIVGCLVVIPGLVSGRVNAGSKVPFGPLLIIGFVAAIMFTPQIESLFGLYSLL